MRAADRRCVRQRARPKWWTRDNPGVGSSARPTPVKMPPCAVRGMRRPDGRRRPGPGPLAAMGPDGPPSPRTWRGCDGSVAHHPGLGPSPPIPTPGPMSRSRRSRPKCVPRWVGRTSRPPRSSGRSASVRAALRSRRRTWTRPRPTATPEPRDCAPSRRRRAPGPHRTGHGSTREECFQLTRQAEDHRRRPPRLRSLRFDALRASPILGVPGLVEQGTRVPASGSNGWAAGPSRRAGGARVRRPTAPPARTWGRREGTPKVIGPESAKAHVLIPPMRGRSVPGLACSSRDAPCVGPAARPKNTAMSRVGGSGVPGRGSRPPRTCLLPEMAATRPRPRHGVGAASTRCGHPPTWGPRVL